VLHPQSFANPWIVIISQPPHREGIIAVKCKVKTFFYLSSGTGKQIRRSEAD